MTYLHVSFSCSLLGQVSVYEQQSVSFSVEHVIFTKWKRFLDVDEQQLWPFLTTLGLILRKRNFGPVIDVFTKVAGAYDVVVYIIKIFLKMV